MEHNLKTIILIISFAMFATKNQVEGTCKEITPLYFKKTQDYNYYEALGFCEKRGFRGMASLSEATNVHQVGNNLLNAYPAKDNHETFIVDIYKDKESGKFRWGNGKVVNINGGTGLKWFHGKPKGKHNCAGVRRRKNFEQLTLVGLECDSSASGNHRANVVGAICERSCNGLMRAASRKDQTGENESGSLAYFASMSKAGAVGLIVVGLILTILGVLMCIASGLRRQPYRGELVSYKPDPTMDDPINPI